MAEELRAGVWVLAVQEHRLCQARWIATVPALKRLGWDAYAGVLGLADVSSHGMRLGGTAVLVRTGLPVTLLPIGLPDLPLQGRLTCVRLEARGSEMAVASAYFHAAEALGPRSRAMLAYCLDVLPRIPRQWIVGADWQNEPKAVLAAPVSVTARVAACAPSAPTIQPSGRVIDF